jgi:hypothetical protein
VVAGEREEVFTVKTSRPVSKSERFHLEEEIGMRGTVFRTVPEGVFLKWQVGDARWAASIRTLLNKRGVGAAPAFDPQTGQPVAEQHTTISGSHAAEETARVLYEDRPRKVKPLKWHRTKAGYQAQGTLGRYSIVRRKPDRRHDVLPVVLSLNDVELKSFDTKGEAQTYGNSYEMIASSPTLSPNIERTIPIARRSEPAAGAHCGPFARLAVDPKAAAACQKVADEIGPIDSPEDLYRVVSREYASYLNEAFIVVPMDVHNKLLPAANGGVIPPIRVGEGQRSKVTVDTADILRAAILSGCSSYAVVHNHPGFSGKAASSADKHLLGVIEKAHDAAFGKTRGVPASVKLWGNFVIWRGGITNVKTGKQYRVK